MAFACLPWTATGKDRNSTLDHSVLLEDHNSVAQVLSVLGMGERGGLFAVVQGKALNFDVLAAEVDTGIVAEGLRELVRVVAEVYIVVVEESHSRSKCPLSATDSPLLVLGEVVPAVVLQTTWSAYGPDGHSGAEKLAQTKS